MLSALGFFGARLKSTVAVVVVAAQLAMSAAAPPAARAYHTEEQRWVDTTAYTLRGGEFSLGLSRLQAGIIDQLSIATFVLPYVVVGVFGGFGPSLELKYMFYDRKGLSLALSAAVFFGNPKTDAGIRIRYLNIPFRLSASYRINDTWSVHGDVVAGWANVYGGQSEDDEEISGTLVASQVHLTAMVELRISRVTAFTLTGRYLPWISDSVVEGQADASDVTTLFFNLEFAFEDFKNAWNVVAGALFSWKVVNLNVGIGYGDFFIPGMGLVVPGPVPVPQFDLFFRF